MKAKDFYKISLDFISKIRNKYKRVRILRFEKAPEQGYVEKYRVLKNGAISINYGSQQEAEIFNTQGGNFKFIIDYYERNNLEYQLEEV